MNTKPKIWVIDDEIDTCELLEILLSDYYKVTTTTDALKALEILPTVKPDLILLDLKMPNVDGLDVCKKIRSSLDPIFRQTPVVIFSAKSDRKDIQQALDSGADDYIIKPFSHDHLLEVVNKNLGIMDKNTPKQ